MNVLDLFSGIGGFSLGLERAGMRTIAFCEIEPYCRKILRKHWPDVPIFEDVRELHAENLPEPVDLICGGYPCQPFSVAGKRRGAEDDRHLWPEIVRLIRELDAAGNKPAWCLFENVAGHISMGLDTVLSDLESQGYAAWPLVIPACALNAPHRRDRVWILAHARYRSGRHQQQTVTRRNTSAKRGSNNSKIGESSKVSSFMADSCSTGWEKCDVTTKPNYTGLIAGGSDKTDTNNLQEWTTESPVCRANDGIPCGMGRTKRLKALGNAVVPQIPELIGRAILATA